ncbi:DUF2993 domain-containing protein [Leptolyngbya sp. FACHB-17]|uniref:LmeA family phospholipid-binding protein n=1 Tax=unclassified Leptolyngbya TaxID=2650499 RepID=UPI001680703B|nr:DUF2993 domain-containing protein [Leptolyngbya sp. FACHB-17]MBD2078808.1 DUF2993 domain-containing protein [Leptolyngbya sp. FACHB-17]
MDFFTILLSSLLGILSPTGIVVDRIAESQIRKPLVAAEQLQVRVDNAPSYQIIQGRADRVRIAGRGLFPIQELRIDTLEVETDPVSLQLRSHKLAKPLQAGVRVVLTQADINRALRSPFVTARLRNLGLQLLRRQARQIERYDFLNPQLTLLPQNRIRFQIELQEQSDPAKLKIVAEAEPQIVSGRSLQLSNLKVWANNQPSPEPVTRAIEARIRDRTDLRQLEASNITARILNLKLESSRLEVASFVQIRNQQKKEAR